MRGGDCRIRSRPRTSETGSGPDRDVILVPSQAPAERRDVLTDEVQKKNLAAIANCHGGGGSQGSSPWYRRKRPGSDRSYVARSRVYGARREGCLALLAAGPIFGGPGVRNVGVD